MERRKRREIWSVFTKQVAVGIGPDGSVVASDDERPPVCLWRDGIKILCHGAAAAVVEKPEYTRVPRSRIKVANAAVCPSVIDASVLEDEGADVA